MITQLTIRPTVVLQYEDLVIGMYCVFALKEKDMVLLGPYDLTQIKRIKKSLAKALGAPEPGAISYLALFHGFDIDGTIKGEGVFTVAQEKRILLTAPYIVFRSAAKG